MAAAPPGMYQVHLGGGNTACEANELAISLALRHYARDHKVAPGSLCVLGFQHSSHGRSTAALSASCHHANPSGLPAFPWPKADYPQL